MSLAVSSDVNKIITALVTARNKYYSGFQIESNVVAGEKIAASKINNLSSQCLAVTNKSPLRFSYGSVVSGEIIRKPTLDSMLSNINQVANCYSNCHSNCHSNCRCTCTCTGTNGCGNK